MVFREFGPFCLDTGSLQSVELTPGAADGQEGIVGAVGDEEALFLRGGREFFRQIFHIVHVTADAHERPEAMRVTASGLDGHEAALGEAEEAGVRTREARAAEGIEQGGKETVAAGYAGVFLAGEVIPGVSAEVGVRRVDEEVVQPRQAHLAWEPAVAFHAIAQAVQDHEKFLGVAFHRRDQFRLKHGERIKSKVDGD